jgi:hypothetical protein
MLLAVPSLLADIKENHTLLWFYKNLQKIRETRTLESDHEYHFIERENEGRKTRQEIESEKTRVLCPETSTKNVVQEFHLGSQTRIRIQKRVFMTKN